MFLKEKRIEILVYEDLGQSQQYEHNEERMVETVMVWNIYFV